MQAIGYQIIIMFFLAATAALGTSAVVLLGYRRLFTADHQFRPDRFRQPTAGGRP